MEKYDHKLIESKWQKKWAEDQVDSSDKSIHKKEKYYVLDMLPYPSGDGLHMGHTESYTASDIMYRYKRMQGYHVLHNQAFDSFGLPAENYAVKTGIHPAETVERAGKNFLKQMKSLGLGYDYNDVFWTSSREFYRWTQWFFAQFYTHDLVYKDTQTVNWCPSCNTTLANEQVEAGVCERCKSEVMQKEIPGWYFRITQFADELIHQENTTIDWPAHTMKNQNAWIGKSEGAEISFSIKNHSETIEVFTTRPDTLFGATYLVLAPEHASIAAMRDHISNIQDVETYIQNTNKKSELERLENKEKTGVRLDEVWAINPASGEEIPVYIADYVLAGYGTGAIMAVPAHDERDYEFAIQFDLPIRSVVAPQQITHVGAMIEVEGQPGTFLFQKRSADAPRFPGKIAIFGGTREKGETVEQTLIRELKEELDLEVSKDMFGNSYSYASANSDYYVSVTFIHGINPTTLTLGEGEAIVSMSIDEALAHEDLNESLKIFLQNYQAKRPFSLREGSLFNSNEYDEMASSDAKQAIVKKVGGKMTSTYRLKDWSISRQRYWGAPIPIVYDPEGKAHLVPDKHLPWELPTDVDFVPKGTAPLSDSKELLERTERLFGKGWRPETDTLDTFVCSSWYYLRYPDAHNSKIWCDEKNTKYWQPVDLYIGGAEHTYMHLLYSRFWVKAMKSIGLIDFEEPFVKLRHQGYVLDVHGKKMSKSKGNVVNPDEIVERFGADAVRLYMMFAGPLEDEVTWNENGVVGMYRFLEKVWRQKEKLTKEDTTIITKQVHKTIKKVTEDIEGLKFNTAISAMMVCVNEMDKSPQVRDSEYTTFIKLLSVFAPHISQEIIESVEGEVDYVSDMSWPQYDSNLVVDELVDLAVQINGKMRGTLQVSPDANEETVLDLVQGTDSLRKWLEEGSIEKVIYVPGRILNIVIA